MNLKCKMDASLTKEFAASIDPPPPPPEITGSVELRQFYRMFWIEYGQIIFYILRFFLYLLRTVLSCLFSIKRFTYFLFHTLILYLVLLILKHMFKPTCINCMAKRFKHVFCISRYF